MGGPPIIGGASLSSGQKKRAMSDFKNRKTLKNTKGFFFGQKFLCQFIPNLQSGIRINLLAVLVIIGPGRHRLACAKNLFWDTSGKVNFIRKFLSWY